MVRCNGYVVLSIAYRSAKVNLCRVETKLLNLPNKYGIILQIISVYIFYYSEDDMRAYYFFMKFVRSFAIGFGCAMITLVIAGAAIFAAYCMFFV